MMGYRKGAMTHENDLEDIKTIFKFILVKIIILGQKIMHVE